MFSGSELIAEVLSLEFEVSSERVCHFGFDGSWTELWFVRE